MILLLYLIVGALIGAYSKMRDREDEEPLNTAEFIIITILWLPFIIVELFCCVFLSGE